MQTQISQSSEQKPRDAIHDAGRPTPSVLIPKKAKTNIAKMSVTITYDTARAN
jgi:hypothetical protein